MAADPLFRLAKQRIVKASADIEIELLNLKGGGPTLEIFHRLQDRAAESLAALAIVEAEDPAAIRTLQNEVKKYDEWVVWMREIIQEGVQYDRETTEEEREELVEFLAQSPDGEQRAIDLGLIDDQRPTDA